MLSTGSTISHSTASDKGGTSLDDSPEKKAELGGKAQRKERGFGFAEYSSTASSGREAEQPAKAVEDSGRKRQRDKGGERPEGKCKRERKIEGKAEQNVILKHPNSDQRSQKTCPDRRPSLAQTLRKLLPGSLRRAVLVILLLVTFSPTLTGRSVRRQLSPLLTSTAAEFDNPKGNLLPLPVGVSGRTDALSQQLTRTVA